MSKLQRKSWGGKRRGAGAHAKAEDQKAVGVTFYLPQFKIDLIGGKEKVRELCLEAVEMVLPK